MIWFTLTVLPGLNPDRSDSLESTDWRLFQTMRNAFRKITWVSTIKQRKNLSIISLKQLKIFCTIFNIGLSLVTLKKKSHVVTMWLWNTRDRDEDQMTVFNNLNRVNPAMSNASIPHARLNSETHTKQDLSSIDNEMTD